MGSLMTFHSVQTQEAICNNIFCNLKGLRENRLNTIMKSTIAVLFLIYIASVTAIHRAIRDLRYPVDSQIIQATLNESEILHVKYNLSENVIDYQIVGSENGCGPHRIEFDKYFEHGTHFQILQLNRDDVLLILMVLDSKFNKYPAAMEIFNLLSCKRSQVVLPNKSKPTEFRISRYNDSFDIYYKDSSTCSKNYCRMSYDFQGKVISTPNITFISDKGVPLIKPIGSGERSNNYLAFEFTNRKTIVNFVNCEKVTVLAETANMTFAPEEDVVLEVSDSHNLISIAYIKDVVPRGFYEVTTDLQLSQFDFNGNVKFTTIVEVNAPSRTIRLLNAPNGGVYMVASACDRDHCTDEENIYYAKKIDANGKEVGSFSFTIRSPGVIEDLAFYEAEGGYCLTRLQMTLGVSRMWQFRKLDALYNYFTDEDFE